MNKVLPRSLTYQVRPVARSLDANRRVSRGRPLIMLALVLGGWTSMRVATWETPFPSVLDAMNSQVQARVSSGSDDQMVGAPEQNVAKPAAAAAFPLADEQVPTISTPPTPRLETMPQTEPDAAIVPSEPPAIQAPAFEAVPAPVESDLQMAASHQLLWMAAMAYMPVPKSVSDVYQRQNAAGQNDAGDGGQPPLALPLSSSNNIDRWSLDAWGFWRQGSTSPLVALGRAPSYGASQAGAVLRYRLDPGSAFAPDAYLRAYSSLEGRTEQELVAGFSTRPLADVPLRVHAEARALHSSGRTRARMAGFVTTEVAPVKLPYGATAEVYGQAGYVSGAQSTAFADGQLHVMREVAGFDLADRNTATFKLGGGAFAGAQKGATRLDVGPTMRLETRIGDTPARLSVDWRERVAGDAEPDSGLAVTLSTRF